MYTFFPAHRWTEPKFLGVGGLRGSELEERVLADTANWKESDPHAELLPKMNQGEMILHVLSLSFPPCKHS